MLLVAEQKERGDKIDIPAWWLAAARKAVDAYPGGLVALGEELATAVGRKFPWSHATVSRFLVGQNTTRQLADAMVEYFDLPPVMFQPRTLEEAMEFRVVAKKHSREKESRLQALDALAGKMEAEIDHGDVAVSKDAPKPSGRRI